VPGSYDCAIDSGTTPVEDRYRAPKLNLKADEAKAGSKPKAE
jgi:hypothetical protein